MNLLVEFSGVLSQAAGADASYGTVERVIEKQAVVYGREYDTDKPVSPGDLVLLSGEKAYSLVGVSIFIV